MFYFLPFKTLFWYHLRFWPFLGIFIFTFDISSKLSPQEKVCMKYQILFSGKIEKNNTLEPLYNIVHYKTVLDIRQLKDGQSSVVSKQKCID